MIKQGRERWVSQGVRQGQFELKEKKIKLKLKMGN